MLHKISDIGNLEIRKTNFFGPPSKVGARRFNKNVRILKADVGFYF